MNMSSALPDGVRSLLACLAASILAGCTIVPGNQGYSNREESEVRLPVQQGDVRAPANIKIKPVTAELTDQPATINVDLERRPGRRLHRLAHGGGPAKQ